MKLKTCEYCGTEYNSELRTCPLCGKTSAPPQADMPEPPVRRSKSGARVAPKQSHRSAPPPDQDKIPRWMWALICMILGLAVVIGAGYFVYVMGFFSPSEPAASDTVIQGSDTLPEDDTTGQTDSDSEDTPDDTDETVTTGVPCTSLTLSMDSLTLDSAGAHVFLTAVSRPADCTDEIVFSSSDESVVSINENGQVTAVGPGSADIIVTCGSITERCAVTCDFEVQEPEDTDTDTDTDTDPDTDTDTQPDVAPSDGSGASLSSTDFTLFSPGEKTTLTVKNAPAGATISYVSSNANVVTVTNTGEVTAVGSGTATITVTVNSTKLTCIARCNLGDSAETGNGGTTTDDGTTYALSHVDATLFSSGESFQITVSPAPGSVSWSTSNSAVCTVDSGGTVTAVGSGTANVTATINGKTYTCIVRCNF